MYTLTLAGVIRGSCDLGYRISAATSILGRLAVLIVWGIRTYTVCNNSRIVAAWLLFLGVGCVVANIVSVFSSKCDWQDSIPLAGLLFGILLGLFELSAAILTITRCVRALRAGGGWRAQKDGLFALILEQGTLYIIVVCIFTAVPYLVNFILHAPAIQRLLNAYPMPVTGLITARFLLYLREWEERLSMQQGEGGTITEQESIQFRPPRSVGISSFVDEFGRNSMLNTTGNRVRVNADRAAV